MSTATAGPSGPPDGRSAALPIGQTEAGNRSDRGRPRTATSLASAVAMRSSWPADTVIELGARLSAQPCAGAGRGLSRLAHYSYSGRALAPDRRAWDSAHQPYRNTHCGWLRYVEFPDKAPGPRSVAAVRWNSDTHQLLCEGGFTSVMISRKYRLFEGYPAGDKIAALAGDFRPIGRAIRFSPAGRESG